MSGDRIEKAFEEIEASFNKIAEKNKAELDAALIKPIHDKFPFSQNGICAMIASIGSGKSYNYLKSIAKQEDEEDGLQTIRANSVGFTLSTPILYLTSNVGIQSYRTNKDELRSAKIVMRINNSFISDCPIIVNNADFKTTISSNDLSMLEFTLVDANFLSLRYKVEY